MPEPKQAKEAATVEGRLADLIEAEDVHIGVYHLSDNDRRVIVLALRDRARWMASDITSGERERSRKRQPR